MISLELPMPVSTNRLWRSVGRRVIKSEAYRIWIEDAGWRLRQQRPGSIKGPVELSLTIGKTRSDLSNGLKSVEDLLVTHGIIEGDGPAIVRKINLALDESVKGCRVTVKPFCVSRVVERSSKREATGAHE